jgi:hypothetical protein
VKFVGVAGLKSFTSTRIRFMQSMRYRIFVVPAKVVALKTYRHWLECPRRDGSPRMDKGYVVISWTGKDTATNIGNGFAEKWAKYENAWDLLER